MAFKTTQIAISRIMNLARVEIIINTEISIIDGIINKFDQVLIGRKKIELARKILTCTIRLLYRLRI